MTAASNPRFSRCPSCGEEITDDDVIGISDGDSIGYWQHGRDDTTGCGKRWARAGGNAEFARRNIIAGENRDADAAEVAVMKDRDERAKDCIWLSDSARSDIARLINNERLTYSSTSEVAAYRAGISAACIAIDAARGNADTLGTKAHRTVVASFAGDICDYLRHLRNVFTAGKPSRLVASHDPEHDGNSPRHHTGKSCIRQGCTNPAGTAWGKHWCFEHNVERLDGIEASLRAIGGNFEVRKIVAAEVAMLREHIARLEKQRDAAALMNWRRITPNDYSQGLERLVTFGAGHVIRRAAWYDHREVTRDGRKYVYPPGWYEITSVASPGYSILDKLNTPHYVCDIPAPPSPPSQS